MLQSAPLQSPSRDLLLGISLSGLVAILWLGVAHPIVAPAIALLPIGAIVAFRKAFLLGVAFILFSFFRIHEVLPFLMPLKLPLLLALGTVVALTWNIAFGHIRPYWDKKFTPFILFFLLVTFSIPAASNFGNSLDYWKDTYVKIAIMVFAIAWLIRRDSDFATMMRGILAAAGLVSIVALINKATGIGLVEGTRVTIGRDIGSMLGDPNDLSLVLLFGAGVAASTALTKGLPTLERVAAIVVFCGIAAAIVATQSRGGLLGIAAIVGLFLQRRVRSKALMAVIGVIGLAVLFAAADVSSRKSGGAHEEGIDESAMGRIHAWKAAGRMAMSNPVTGVGLDNFIFNYFDYSDHWDGQNHAVHSTWFGVLGETGLAGFSLFVWMMIAIYRGIQRASQLIKTSTDPPPRMTAVSDGLLSGLLGFCVSGTFLTQGFTWPVYIILAMTIALTRYTETHIGNQLSQNEKDGEKHQK